MKENDIKIPKYQIIESDIIDKINQGIYVIDSPLPTEAELCKMYECSRVTVRQALSNLSFKGFIHKKKGSGAYINQSQLMQKAPSIKSFTDEMIEMGKKPHSIVNTFNITQAGRTISHLLQIQPQDRVYYIERTRLADNIPMMFERTFMSVEMHPEMSMKILESSKYKYGEEHGFSICYSYQNITPAFPSDYIAQELKISTKQPILRVINTTYLNDGRIFDYTEFFMNTDYYQLNLIKGAMPNKK